MKKAEKYLFVPLVGLLGVFLVSPAHAGKERIAGLTVDPVTIHEIRISATLIRWMNPELKKAIQDGIPKDLFYTMILKKKIPILRDRKVQTMTIKHTIKYDVLNKNYQVISWNAETSRVQVTETFDEMMDLISKINNVKMTLKSRLRKRHTYYLSLKAEVRESRFPFFLKYILFFIPGLELNTPWAHSSLFYSPESH